MTVNLYTAWVGFFLGGVAGAIPGLFFHSEDWLGGYGAWRRRMVRLGHISFWGIGLINLSFALTVRALGLQDGLILPSRLFMVAAVTMPLVCYLSAFRAVFRHLFFVPATSVLVGVAAFLWRILG